MIVNIRLNLGKVLIAKDYSRLSEEELEQYTSIENKPRELFLKLLEDRSSRFIKILEMNQEERHQLASILEKGPKACKLLVMRNGHFKQYRFDVI